MHTRKDLVEDLHHASDSNARKWGQMLAAPQDLLVRAPSNTPFLASKTRFVKSIDIPYSATNNGRFLVAQFPNPTDSYAVTGAPVAFPAAPAYVGLNSSLGGIWSCTVDAGESNISRGILSANDGNGVNIGTTQFGPLDTVDAVGAGYSGVIVTLGNGCTHSTTISGLAFSLGSLFVRFGQIRSVAGAAKSIVWSTVSSLSTGTATYTATLGGTTVDYATIVQFCTSAGVPKPLTGTKSFDFSSTYTLAQVPTSVNTTSMGLVDSGLLDAGRVTLQRCTAMSMLVTDMTPQLDAGGELVVARANFNVLTTPGGISGIMSAIKQLPEENYWQSDNMRHGSYTWWLPDDLLSYEPRALDTIPPTENVLIAAGKMPADTGAVRVIMTWTFEFYTPVQLFSRDYNVTYSQAHRDMFIALSRAKACSHNAGHAALVASVMALAQAVYTFYDKNREAIDGLAAAGYKTARLVGQQVKKKKKKSGAAPNPQPQKKGQKQGTRPLPPLPPGAKGR